MCESVDTCLFIYSKTLKKNKLLRKQVEAKYGSRKTPANTLLSAPFHPPPPPAPSSLPLRLIISSQKCLFLAHVAMEAVFRRWL